VLTGLISSDCLFTPSLDNMKGLSGTLRPPGEKKSTFMDSTSNQPITDQSVDDKKKGAADKEVVVDPDDTDKKLCLNIELDAK
jgi:hypothetical protein